MGENKPHFFDGQWWLLVDGEWEPLDNQRCPGCNRPFGNEHKVYCVYAVRPEHDLIRFLWGIVANEMGASIDNPESFEGWLVPVGMCPLLRQIVSAEWQNCGVMIARLRCALWGKHKWTGTLTHVRYNSYLTCQVCGTKRWVRQP